MIDLCKPCIEFAGQFINQLLNIILNAGVVGGCADLCGILANKTNSQAAGIVCNLLCDVVGIKEFINIIEEADLDPIYYCELLKTCEINDNGDAKINSLVIDPQTVVRGSQFSIVMNFTTVHGTGTGEYSVLIKTVDGIPIGQRYLTEPQPPGTYVIKWDASAKPDPNCDPTQGPCETWQPGQYSASVAICNGECGSKHPHSQIYDTGSANFNVTAQ